MHINLFGLRIGIFTKTQLNALASVAMSEVDKAIVAAKQTELGSTVANAIKDIKNQNLDGNQKFEAVLKDVMPTIMDYASRGGISVAISDVEDFGRQLVQSVFNDTLSTKAVTVASAIFAYVKTLIK